jgi:DNA helicase II / ATP-dependent DNA helicase PcrA
MAVGDDDQSIYGWRGARIENIQRFPHDFADVRTIRLEQNYRSTGTILNAANALIDHNQDRLGKQLWTDGGEGDPILVYAAYNELDEARFIADRIDSWIRDGGSPQEAAILYRSNAQSRVLEEALAQAADSVSHLWRSALFRARGNQECAGLYAADHQSAFGSGLRAHGQHADARHW